MSYDYISAGAISGGKLPVDFGFSTLQLRGLRYALEQPEIVQKVASLPFLVKEEEKAAVFTALGEQLRAGGINCAHCHMPRWDHIKDKCLFESTTFAPLTLPDGGWAKQLGDWTFKADEAAKIPAQQGQAARDAYAKFWKTKP